MDSKLILPVEGHQLAEFIYSLLGQRRTIEKIFRVKSLSVTHGNSSTSLNS
jgi:hypothetical protein